MFWPIIAAKSYVDEMGKSRKGWWRLLAKTHPPVPLRYADHVDGCGMALFQRVCELDLEGIVAKEKFGPYVTEREQSTWFKIRNPEYSKNSWAGGAVRT